MRTVLVTLAGVALLSWPTRARAEPVELPPVVVPVPDDLPEPATLERADPSGARSAVAREAHQGEAKDSAELIATSVGAQLQDSGGLGQMKTLSLRGASGNGVLVYLDGVPLQGSGGMVDLARIPAALVDRFELLRGGAGGLGGSLNIVTRQPSRGARIAGEASYGSFSTLNAHLAASGALWGGSGLVLAHVARSAGDFRYLHDEAPSDPNNALLSLERENNQSLMGGALLKYERPLPGGFSLNVLTDFIAQNRGLAGTVRNPTSFAHEEDRRWISQVSLKRSFDSGAQLTARAFSRWETLNLGDVAQQEVVAGGELSGSALIADVHGLSASAQLSHQGLAVRGGAGAGWLRAVLTAMDELLLLDGALTVAPSLRLDVSGAFVTFSPKLGASYAFAQEWELRANAGQAHRAPSFLELYVRQGQMLPNPELKPERALSADAALTRRFGDAALTVGGFFSRYDNLISYEYYPPLLVKPYNLRAAQAYGLEVEGQLKPARWVSASAAYALLFTQNLQPDDGRYDGNAIPYRPRHRLSARLSAGPTWARGRAEVLLQSEMAMNRTGTPRIPGRAFVNLGLSSQLPVVPKLVISLELKNALDVYAVDLTDYPLPGRAMYVTVSFVFDAGTGRKAAP